MDGSASGQHPSVQNTMGIRTRIRILVCKDSPWFSPEERQQAAESGRMDLVTIWTGHQEFGVDHKLVYIESP